GAPRHLSCATRRYPLYLSNLKFCTGASRQPILCDAQLPEVCLQLLDSTARRAKPGCTTRNFQRFLFNCLIQPRAAPNQAARRATSRGESCYLLNERRNAP
ncbi:hypothetical protein A2U01_0064248, partial [Trifolium medium]|nr:hypothetical protein [Trifolium medium]